VGRVGITFEQVVEAADHILASGHNPTIEKIRRQLGDTGSNSSIGKYLNQWKAERLKRPILNAQVFNWDDPLQKAIHKAVELVKSETQEEVVRIQQAAEMMIAEAEKGRAEAFQEVQRLQETLNKTQLSLNHLQADITLIRNELAEERKNHAITTARAHQSEKDWQTHIAETNKHIEQLLKAHEESINHLKAQLKSLNDKYEQDITYYKTHLEDQRTKLILEIDQLKTLTNSQKDALARKEAEVGALQLLNKDLTEQKRGFEVDLKVSREERLELERQVALINGANQQKDVFISKLEKQIERLQQNLMIHIKEDNKNLVLEESN